MTADAEAWIVVDLGFGDAGKGLLTDHLVRRLGAHTVVRFHGGAQAGHNVVTADGRHHTFSQLGAGTVVPGVRTYLSRDVVIHPSALLVEAAHLAEVGVPDALERLEVSEEALVITPFQQAAGRLRERARGDGAHGSCGVGFGETVRDALGSTVEPVRAGELRDLHRLRAKLLRVQEHKRAELRADLGAPAGWLDAERRILEDTGPLDRWRAILAKLPLGSLVDEGAALRRMFARRGALVLEGAQGVLLDEWRGFHPHTTWSTCTFERALALLRGADRAPVRLGVLRTYATRHGAGPLPTEDRTLDALLPEPHNQTHPFQGRFRRGWFDAVLARYALEAVGGVDRFALTHLDAVDRLERWRMAIAYAHRGTRIERLPLGVAGDLDHTAALGVTLRAVEPAWSEPRPTRAAVLEAIESALEIPVSFTATGPTAADVAPRA